MEEPTGLWHVVRLRGGSYHGHHRTISGPSTTTTTRLSAACGHPDPEGDHVGRSQSLHGAEGRVHCPCSSSLCINILHSSFTTQTVTVTRCRQEHTLSHTHTHTVFIHTGEGNCAGQVCLFLCWRRAAATSPHSADDEVVGQSHSAPRCCSCTSTHMRNSAHAPEL
ncbi:hypothetical protein INR49_011568, partial [Caranx melampygus]